MLAHTHGGVASCADAPHRNARVGEDGPISFRPAPISRMSMKSRERKAEMFEKTAAYAVNCVGNCAGVQTLTQ